MIQLAMYKAKGLIGNAIIRAWTRSVYSHCELSTGDGVWMSSSIMDHGVRGKAMVLDPTHWDVIELPWARDTDVMQHFERTRGEPYGWTDLVRAQVLNRPFDEDGASFCSEWCAGALGLPSPTSYSPATLLKLCIYLNAR